MEELFGGQEMNPVEPVAGVEHTPVGMDPVENFEKARTTMEAQMKQLNAELIREREARLAAEQDRDLIRQDRDRAEKHMEEIEHKLLAVECSLDKYRDVIRSERAFWKKKLQKPILWPCLLVAGFAVLALLIGVAVDRTLMSQLLGEPMGYLSICVCAFFVGIVWDRTEVNRHGDSGKSCSN